MSQRHGSCSFSYKLELRRKGKCLLLLYKRMEIRPELSEYFSTLLLVPLDIAPPKPQQELLAGIPVPEHSVCNVITPH